MAGVHVRKAGIRRAVLQRLARVWLIFDGGTLTRHSIMAAKPAASPQTTFPLDAEGRAQAKRWLDNWKRVGPILEAERLARLASMTDEEARRASLLVLELWQPGWHGGDGEELLIHQRVFARARR